MWVPLCVITEGLNGHHRPDDTIFKARGCAEKDLQAVCCCFTQGGKEITVIKIF